jgi:hypothetical protein
MYGTMCGKGATSTIECLLLAHSGHWLLAKLLSTLDSPPACIMLQGIALEQERSKARQARQAQIERETRQRELRDLHLKVTQQDWWQRHVDTAARNALAQRQRQALVADLERMISPPAPAPEPTVVYVEAAEGSDQLGTSDFNPKLWMQKPRSWW